MVGAGRASISEVCDISRANVADGVKSEALIGLTSLGSFGKYENNQERDLHRWMKGSFAMTLEPLEIPMDLNVPWKMFLYIYTFRLWGNRTDTT